MTKLRAKLYPSAPWAVGVLIGLAAMPVFAVDFKSADGNWTFSVAGNVNVHYIYSNCEDSTSASDVVGGLACTGTKSGSNVSSVGNGLLPAAITFGLATTQDGFDIAGHFGLYPGIATNDGGSPNLQQTTGNGSSNTALGTTGLDVRQVYLTFGNKDMGTFTFGRNFGLFGFDAIINDMTLPGVGVAGSASGASPSNTTLGSIGLGYIYVDTLAQMDYTTPDFSGFNLTIGIFEPINSQTNHDTVAGKKVPGFHGKLAYTYAMSTATKLYLSAAFLSQDQKYINGAGNPYSYTGTGFDVFAKIDVNDFEAFGYYYHGTGLGTTGFFVLSDDGLGNTRTSYGYLAQATYKFGKAKVGVNYGASQLDYANAADRTRVEAVAGRSLLSKNRKVTGGVYYALTKNLTILGEVSDVHADAHSGSGNHSTNFNAGAFLSF
jgi:predicted porin